MGETAILSDNGNEKSTRGCRKPKRVKGTMMKLRESRPEPGFASTMRDEGRCCHWVTGAEGMEIWMAHGQEGWCLIMNIKLGPMDRLLDMATGQQERRTLKAGRVMIKGCLSAKQDYEARAQKSAAWRCGGLWTRCLCRRCGGSGGLQSKSVMTDHDYEARTWRLLLDVVPLLPVMKTSHDGDHRQGWWIRAMIWLKNRGNHLSGGQADNRDGQTLSRRFLELEAEADAT